MCSTIASGNVHEMTTVSRSKCAQGVRTSSSSVASEMLALV